VRVSVSATVIRVSACVPMLCARRVSFKKPGVTGGAGMQSRDRRDGKTSRKGPRRQGPRVRRGQRKAARDVAGGAASSESASGFGQLRGMVVRCARVYRVCFKKTNGHTFSSHLL
jgi:hypothetical protein